MTTPHNSRFIGKAQLINKDGLIVQEVECNHHQIYYREIFKAMEIAAQKNHDYAGGLDTHPLANFLECESSNIDPKQGLWLRMLDKIGRVKTFFRTGKLAVTSEPVADAFRDTGNYSFLMLALMHHLNGTGNIPAPPANRGATFKAGDIALTFSDPYDTKN